VAFRKWIDIDKWPNIDLDDIIAQSDTLSNDLNKDAIKDAIQTIKNSLSFLEKKKCTKEERDRMTKERINILLRQGFRIRLKETISPPPQDTAVPSTQKMETLA
jgi:cob(I)alamin adenosyltransferase